MFLISTPFANREKMISRYARLLFFLEFFKGRGKGGLLIVWRIVFEKGEE